MREWDGNKWIERERERSKFVKSFKYLKHEGLSDYCLLPISERKTMNGKYVIVEYHLPMEQSAGRDRLNKSLL